MGRKVRVYSRVEEADGIIKAMCEKQPDAMGFVVPKSIAVMAIENSERAEKNHTLAKIKPIKGAEKTLFQLNGIPVRYIIVCYWSDWNGWSMKQKQWVLFHELLHCHPDFEKTIRHDCEDFKIILDKVGVEWFNKKDGLPDLINDEVKFNLDYRPGIKDLMDGEDGDEIPEKDEE